VDGVVVLMKMRWWSMMNLEGVLKSTQIWSSIARKRIF
jgi:hypothetical protein